MALGKRAVVLAAVVGLGLATAGARAQDVGVGTGPATITITMTDYKFTPAEITLDHGQPYLLHIVNDGKKSHDISAKAFFRAAQVSPDDTAKVKDGVIELTVGESTDVGIIAGKAGTYEMHCDHPLHAMLGMKGTIVVR